MSNVFLTDGWTEAILAASMIDEVCKFVGSINCRLAPGGYIRSKRAENGNVAILEKEEEDLIKRGEEMTDLW